MFLSFFSNSGLSMQGVELFNLWSINRTVLVSYKLSMPCHTYVLGKSYRLCGAYRENYSTSSCVVCVSFDDLYRISQWRKKASRAKIGVHITPLTLQFDPTPSFGMKWRSLARTHTRSHLVTFKSVWHKKRFLFPLLVASFLFLFWHVIANNI